MQECPKTAADFAKRRPLDAETNDPKLRRLVRVDWRGGNSYARIFEFPDGSALEDHFFAAEEGKPSDAPKDAPKDLPKTAATGTAEIGAADAARKLAAAAAGTLLYDAAAGRWLAFDGTIWRRASPLRQIHETLHATLRGDPGPSLVAAVEQLARTEPALQAGREGWDADLWRLGTPGGTVDLTTGTLHPADPADRITRATAVAPAEVSDCPLWRRFLDEATGGDVACQTFLQRFCGYALTGETCEHALLFGLGEGGNGKSVFVNTVRGIFGDYAIVGNVEKTARRRFWEAEA